MSSDIIRLPRVLIADDDKKFRFIVKTIVSTECELVGEADNGAAAVELAGRLCPDLVLLDISMPVMTGLEAARLILERGPKVRILIVSSNTNPSVIEEAYQLGASGYVLKSTAMEQLPQAIHDTLEGKIFRAR